MRGAAAGLLLLLAGGAAMAAERPLVDGWPDHAVGRINVRGGGFCTATLIGQHQALTAALVASAGLAVLATVVRLVQRTPVTQAVSGLLGVAIGVFWAWRSGQAQDYFAWGLWVNVAWCLGTLATIVARWPFVGVVVSMFRGEDFSWRTERSLAAAHQRRRYTWASWLWVAMFGARLAVQLPLYFAGEEAVGWLGTAKLAMGLPLTGLTLWVTWLLVRSPEAREAPADPPRHP